MSASSVLIAIPVFNDWESISVLISQIDEALLFEKLEADILILNDGSTVTYQESFTLPMLKAIKQIHLLNLKRNLGHQRAIAIGLCYIEESMNCEAVIVMDGDGEDAPTDIPRLIHKCREQNHSKIVFARRTQRSETLLFKAFYRLYKYLFKSLTGENMEIGNFSIIPFNLLERVVILSETWNHFAAGILKAKIPFMTIPCKRSSRIAGRSKMNFVSLVMHGLSAISVYGDVIGIKALLATIGLMLGSIFLVAVVVIVRVAVPNWAPYVAGLSFIVFLQCMTASLAFIFLVLNGRNNFSFLPKRDYRYFVHDIREIFSNNTVPRLR
ncbi:putative glycosyl transferase [Leptolyngbya sp. NIES-3755]|nr:putative glycosyl transferase [Leptolyngbya sp. NIES-3755]